MSAGADQPPNDRDPALALLRDLGDKATLSTNAKRRIAAALERGAPRTRGTLVVLACAGALAAVAVVLLLRGGHPKAPQAASRQKLLVPACGLSRFSDEAERYRAVFVGPSEATVETGGRVLLASGRVVIAAAERGVALETQGARISVEPRSFVEVVVRDYHGARVAVYEGAARLQVAQQLISLAAGDAWEDAALTRVDPSAATAARRIVEEDGAVSPACRAEAPVISPSPAPAPPPPPARRRVAAPVVVEQHDEPPVFAAPIEAPAPTAPSAAEPPSETALLAKAIEQLRSAHDPRAALALLDEHERAHPAGGFTRELALVRLEALLALGDRAAALGVLDALALPNGARSDELLATRADLRAHAGRCAEAVDDYDRVLPAATGARAEAALIGRAGCRFQLGREREARADLAAYLDRFPNGTFAAEARRALGR